jgi:hypothetical protein
VARTIDVMTRLQYVFESLQLTASSVSQTLGFSLDPSALPAFKSSNFVGEPLTRATRESMSVCLISYHPFAEPTQNGWQTIRM